MINLKSRVKAGGRCEACGLPVVSVGRSDYCITVVLVITGVAGAVLSLVMAAVLGVAL